MSRGPSGPRFGTLVHRVLRDSIGDTEIPQQVVESYGRILGATHEEMEVTQQVVTSALSHPLLKRARSSPRCHREVPITLRLVWSRRLTTDWVAGFVSPVLHMTLGERDQKSHNRSRIHRRLRANLPAKIKGGGILLL